MKPQILAVVLTMVLISSSFAQAAQNYCAKIVTNETEQIKILNKIKKEYSKSSKLRFAAVDDLIQSRQLTLTKVQAMQSCSAEQYKASLISLLNERITLEQASIEAMDKLIIAMKDQKGNSASFLTGVGVAGLLYTFLVWKNGAFYVKLFLAGISLVLTMSGGQMVTVDHFTLEPVLNDLIDVRNETAIQLEIDRNQLKVLVDATLN